MFGFKDFLNFSFKAYKREHPSWQPVLHTSQILAIIKKARTDFFPAWVHCGGQPKPMVQEWGKGAKLLATGLSNDSKSYLLWITINLLLDIPR